MLAGDVARREVPTCAPADQVGRIRQALSHTPGFCVVVNQAGVVCGLVQDVPPDTAPDTPVSAVMDYGITTVRPAEEASGLLERMGRAQVAAILLTRSDGSLYGLLVAAEAQAALASLPENSR